MIQVIQAEGQKTSALVVADSLYAVGNYSEALQQYDQIPQKDEAIFLKIARAHQAKGTLDNALIFYKKASPSTQFPIACNEYGKLLISKSKFETADSLFTVLINAFPTNPNFFYQRGRARQRIKPETEDSLVALQIETLDRGLSDFKEAIRLDSTHQKAIYEASKLYLKDKEYGLAEQLCNKALATYPENVEIISILAQTNYYKGYFHGAIPMFEKLLELGQDTQFIREKLGYSYYKTRFYELAIAQYLEALKYTPNDSYIHFLLAKLYNFMLDFDRAELHGKAAILLKDLPLDEEYYTLANTYKIHKDFEQAMEYLNLTLSENPDHKLAIYAKAVVADNYYADKEAVIKLYEQFIEKYDHDYDPYIKSAKSRVKLLKQEVFMAADDN